MYLHIYGLPVNSLPEKPNECVCNVMRRAARSLTNAYDKALAPSGLRVTQFSMLTAISRLSVASVTQLSELLGLDQTTATRNLMLLEDAGFIERVAHHDPRVKLLKVTDKGKKKLIAATACWREMQEQIKSALSQQEWTNFRDTLGKIEGLALLPKA